MLGGLFSGTFSRARRHGWMVIGAVVAWGVAIAGFGLSGSLWLAVAFLAVAGVADMVSMVFRGAILLSAATDEMRGRMQGVFTVVVAGGPRLADVLHGTARLRLRARARPSRRRPAGRRRHAGAWRPRCPALRRYRI